MTVNSTIPKTGWTQITGLSARCRLTVCSGSLWWRSSLSDPGLAAVNGHYLATRQSLRWQLDGNENCINDQCLWVRAVGDEQTVIAVDRFDYTNTTSPALP